MTFISGKHIPRRTFIRGMGAAAALPFLDSMIPAGPLGRTVRARLERVRLIAIENVHGAAGSSALGATMNLWAPAEVGPHFTLESENALSPIEEAGFRKYLTIVSNTDSRMAEAFEPDQVGGDHYRTAAVFLTHAHPRRTQGSDVYVGTSMDQLFAQRFGQETSLPSIQLCIESIDQKGGCAYGYTCVYTDSISWASPTEPLPAIRDPRVAFEQLFGAGGTPEDRAARRRDTGSILDGILREMASFKRSLGPADQRRLDQYTENVRELERQIQMTEQRNSSGEPREIPEAPPGVPDSFREHMEMMFDLQALAFQADLTRVFSLKASRDTANRVFPESGVTNAFHPTSHHGDQEEALQDFARINRYHVSLLPYLMEKLQGIDEGGTNLLDKTLIIYGSSMADGNQHNHRRCPLILLGGANGRLSGGTHLKAPDGTPMANVMLSALHTLGLDDLETFGDSTGEFLLTDPGGDAATSS